MLVVGIRGAHRKASEEWIVGGHDQSEQIVVGCGEYGGCR